MSRQQEEISARQHKSWMESTTDRIFVAEENGVAVGTVRFVRHPHELEVGLVVAPEFRGRGYAALMLDLAKAEAWRPLVAYVREDNARSLAAFARAGFKRDDQYVRFTSS